MKISDKLGMDQEDAIRQRYQLLAPELNERTLRLFAAAEAKVIGWGGIAVVSRTLEISRERISRAWQNWKWAKRPNPVEYDAKEEVGKEK